MMVDAGGDDIAFLDTLVMGYAPGGNVAYLPPTQTSTTSATSSGGTVTLTTSTTRFVTQDGTTLSYTATALTYTGPSIEGQLSTSTRFEGGHWAKNPPAMGTSTPSGPIYVASEGNCFKNIGELIEVSVDLSSGVAGLGGLEILAGALGYDFPVSVVAGVTVVGVLVIPLTIIGLQMYQESNNDVCVAALS